MIAKVEIQADHMPGKATVKIDGMDVASVTRTLQVTIGVNRVPEVQLLLVPRVDLVMDADVKLLVYGPFLNALRELLNSHDRSGVAAEGHISPQRMLEIRTLIEQSEAAMEIGPRADANA